METKREKETRSTQEHLEKDRGKRTQMYVGEVDKVAQERMTSGGV